MLSEPFAFACEGEGESKHPYCNTGFSGEGAVSVDGEPRRSRDASTP